MKTGYKLFLGFSIVIILLWVTVYFANNTQEKIRAEFENLEENVIPGVMEISSIQILANQIAHESVVYIHFGDNETKQALQIKINQIDDVGQDFLARETRLGPEEEEAAALLVNKISIFKMAVLQLLLWKDNGMAIESLLVMEKNIHDVLDELIEQFGERKDVHTQQLASAEAAVRRQHDAGVHLLLTVAGLTTVLAMVGAYLVTRAIVKPLHALHKGTEIIGEGNLKHRVGTRAKDEIGQLSRAFDQMTEGLARTTASVTELNKEIAQRERVESELQKKNKQLDAQNAKLQELDRLKSVFLASMSHELRTPLNAIIGFTSLIMQGMVGEINEEQKKQLSLVDSSANHLLSLINDILDIAKIEADRVELSIEEFEFSGLVNDVIGTLTPIADLKKIKLLEETPEGVTLSSDRRRLMQVLINLTGNAVKFTDEGSVKIKSELLGKDRISVSVVDTGIGLKKEDIDKLFTPFQQAGDSLVKKQQGTGLGLYLSRKLVNLLGGDITVKSKFGKGSEFAFTLPFKYSEVTKNEKSVSHR